MEKFILTAFALIAWAAIPAAAQACEEKAAEQISRLPVDGGKKALKITQSCPLTSIRVLAVRRLGDGVSSEVISPTVEIAEYLPEICQNDLKCAEAAINVLKTGIDRRYRKPTIPVAEAIVELARLNPYDELKAAAVNAISLCLDFSVKQPTNSCQKLIKTIEEFKELDDFSIDGVYGLEETLQSLEKFLYKRSPSAKFLQEISKILSRYPQPDISLKGLHSFTVRLFVLNAIRPVMSAVSSKQFKEVIFPAYEKARKRHNDGSEVEDLRDLTGNKETLRVSLEMIRAALDACRPLLDDASQLGVQELQVLIGTSLADELTRPEILRVLAALQKLSPVLEALSVNHKAGGLGILVQSLVESLGEA